MPESSTTQPGPAVFLSYAREDVEQARRIADALRAVGVEVWFTASDSLAGRSTVVCWRVAFDDGGKLRAVRFPGGQITEHGDSLKYAYFFTGYGCP